MLRLTEIKLPLDHSPEAIAQAICQKLKIQPDDLLEYQIFKRSYDARKKSNIYLVYIFDVHTTKDQALLKRFKKDPHVLPTPDMSYKMVAQAPADCATRPIVIGMGPCGMFAGLMLAKMGFRPIVLERGKTVNERTKDTFNFWKKKGEFNPESNAQFGEGGAGTFSDGKLYSQVRDRHHYKRKVLEEFVAAGANPEILYIAKPHIGTFNSWASSKAFAKPSNPRRRNSFPKQGQNPRTRKPSGQRRHPRKWRIYSQFPRGAGHGPQCAGYLPNAP